MDGPFDFRAGGMVGIEMLVEFRHNPGIIRQVNAAVGVGIVGNIRFLLGLPWRLVDAKYILASRASAKPSHPFPSFMKIIALFSALIALFTGKAAAGALKVGDSVPSISVHDDAGNEANPALLAAEGYTLFFFYPKAFTPGCTNQACSLRDASADFTSRGIRIVGVSTDSVATQAKFVAEKKLPYTLLADADKTVSKAFGMQTPIGFAARGAFLAKDGVIVWVDPKASTNDQAAVALKVFDEMKSAAQ